jgi:hypothetical protein
MVLILFSYIRVSQRVWANAASQEKLMDPGKLRKSRTVHLRATVHSCVQVLLILLTLSPHLYEETAQAALHYSSTPVGPQAATATTTTGLKGPSTSDKDNQLLRLLALTLNYALLALG